MFLNIQSSFPDQKIPVYIFGDFNLDALKYGISNQVTEYIDHLFSHGFIQIVMRPTRCTPTTATLIDHIITNSHSTVYETIILVNKISDHFPVFFFSKDIKPKNKPTVIKYQNFSDEAINGFKNNLKTIDWSFLLEKNCVQEQYNEFSDLFLHYTTVPFHKKISVETIMHLTLG